MGISALKRWIKQRFFRLNQDQRKKLSEFCDKAATGAVLPVGIKFLSDEKSGDGFYIFSWLSCAIIFAILSVLALAKGEDDDD
mgnify:FL=1